MDSVFLRRLLFSLIIFCFFACVETNSINNQTVQVFKTGKVSYNDKDFINLVYDSSKNITRVTGLYDRVNHRRFIYDKLGMHYSFFSSSDSYSKNDYGSVELRFFFRQKTPYLDKIGYEPKKYYQGNITLGPISINHKTLAVELVNQLNENNLSFAQDTPFDLDVEYGSVFITFHLNSMKKKYFWSSMPDFVDKDKIEINGVSITAKSVLDKVECYNCGKKNPSHYMFCKYCDSYLDEEIYNLLKEKKG